MRFLHTMLRVRDLDAALDFFVTKLGLREVRRTRSEAGRFTLVFLGTGATGDSAEIELTHNWDEKEPYGTGRFFGHLAFEVDDIYATCERLRANGVAILRPPREGRMAFVKSPDGQSVELLQKGAALAVAEPWASMPNQGSWLATPAPAPAPGFFLPIRRRRRPRRAQSEAPMGKTLELAIAVLNGAVGDHLARTRNGLATSMSLVHEGSVVPLERDALAAAYPAATSKVAVLVHGLMCTESIWDMPGGGDYGAFLARDHGYTPLYVRYNSGLAIPDSGDALAELLEKLVDVYPGELSEILPVAFSMGGLVTRSACHVASLSGHRWLPRVNRAIYVGTPHRGAPLERVGRVVAKVLQAVDDPYTRLIADLANLRSDGVKDLGDADVRHEDRARRRHTFALRDPRHPVPLLPEIRHYLVAGSLSAEPRLAELFGDVMVPVPSATDGQVERVDYALPPSHVKILSGMAHMTLAHHPDVYAQIRAWCEEEA